MAPPSHVAHPQVHALRVHAFFFTRLGTFVRRMRVSFGLKALIKRSFFLSHFSGCFKPFSIETAFTLYCMSASSHVRHEMRQCSRAPGDSAHSSGRLAKCWQSLDSARRVP